jgi:N-hydroxyarylamine O-acetyltransferase
MGPVRDVMQATRVRAVARFTRARQKGLTRKRRRLADRAVMRYNTGVESEQVDRYLDRIGLARPASPDLDALVALQCAHARTVPFENLSIHLGEPIVLAPSELFEKIVLRGRGGFCYELNGLLGVLLAALGYRVELLAARMVRAGRSGPPLFHMALRVRAPHESGPGWLVDVGFGRFDYPPVDLRGDASAKAGAVRVTRDESGAFALVAGDEPQFRFTGEAHELDDFEPTCWWYQTSPRSQFTQSLVCSLPTADGRITLSGRRLISTVADMRTERTLATDDEVLRAYRDHFGIVLDRLPAVRPPQTR